MTALLGSLVPTTSPVSTVVLEAAETQRHHLAELTSEDELVEQSANGPELHLEVYKSGDHRTVACGAHGEAVARVFHREDGLAVDGEAVALLPLHDLLIEGAKTSVAVPPGTDALAGLCRGVGFRDGRGPLADRAEVGEDPTDLIHRCVDLYPESTEGRPWGQSLKKPSGAPLNLG